MLEDRPGQLLLVGPGVGVAALAAQVAGLAGADDQEVSGGLAVAFPEAVLGAGAAVADEHPGVEVAEHGPQRRGPKGPGGQAALGGGEEAEAQGDLVLLHGGGVSGVGVVGAGADLPFHVVRQGPAQGADAAGGAGGPGDGVEDPLGEPSIPGRSLGSLKRSGRGGFSDSRRRSGKKGAVR